MAGGGEVEVLGSKSPVKIMANIFISFIGAGVLGLPFAFKEAGILEGVTIMTLVGVISVKAMLLLIDCKYQLIQKNSGNSVHNGSVKKQIQYKNERNCNSLEKLDLIENEELTYPQEEEPSKPAAPGQHLTYGDVGYYAIGKTGTLMVDLSIIISQIGFCCAYLIFISENLSDYIRGLHLYHWLVIMLPPLFLLTLIRHLSTLAISSLFAQLSNLLAFAVVFWFDFEHFHHVESVHPREFSLEGFPFFLAVAMYCYEGAGMILSLEASLHIDVRHTFKSYFKTTMFIVTFLYITFGASGYLSFGVETNAIITLNLPKGAGLDFAMMVKSCLCLALFFTYPVMMFPVIQLLEKRFFHDAANTAWKGNLLRFVMVTLTGLVVMLIPNFANLMALVGATCCTVLAFVMPGLFHMSIFKGSLTKWQYAFDFTLIIIGVIGAIVGTWDALKRMYEGPDELDDLLSGSPAYNMSEVLPSILKNDSSLINTTSLSDTLTNLTHSLSNNISVSQNDSVS